MEDENIGSSVRYRGLAGKELCRHEKEQCGFLTRLEVLSRYKNIPVMGQRCGYTDWKPDRTTISQSLLV